VTAATSTPAPKAGYLELIVLMGALQAFAPLSIDMYLPSLPELGRTFHATDAAVQFTLVTFFIGFALGQSLYGPITDRYGRKPPLYASLAVFVVTSVACALTPSIGWMSFFRLLQAVGACGGGVMSRAMVRDLFPPEDLRKIFSLLILVLGVSPLVAPMIGSYLLEWFGWRSVFYVQALLGVLSLLSVHFRLSESLAVEARRPLHLERIRDSYRQLFNDRIFLGASLVCGFSSAGMFNLSGPAARVSLALRGDRGRHDRRIANQRPHAAQDPDLEGDARGEPRATDLRHRCAGDCVDALGWRRGSVRSRLRLCERQRFCIP